jgi:hypothetical protein
MIIEQNIAIFYLEIDRLYPVHTIALSYAQKAAGLGIDIHTEHVPVVLYSFPQ